MYTSTASRTAQTTLTQATPILISHPLCPYVQRVAITLAEKGIAFERRYVDLANKPAWFLEISPLGKTPVLLVGDTAIFESAVICEYLDDVYSPRLHPEDALVRAQHRAWMEFGSSILNNIAGFYNAAEATALEARRQELIAKFLQVEAMLTQAPYAAGARFSLVDAVFAPIFRYFEVFVRIDEFDFFAATPKVSAWRSALAERESVRNAVTTDYGQRLWEFLLARDGALAKRMVG